MNTGKVWIADTWRWDDMDSDKSLKILWIGEAFA